MSARRLALGAALAAAALVLPPRALAAPPAGDKAAAQILFDEAYALMKEARFAEACPKLEESARIDAAMGTRFRLAECHEALGRTASAWAGYLEVADLARAAGQEARARVARERADRLRSALARLTVVVDAPAVAGLEIRRDGSVLGSAQWGEPIPVDPGTVHLTASAPGFATWTSDVLVPRSAEALVVRVPALSPLAPKRTLASSDAGEAVRQESASPQRAVGMAMTLVGGAAVLTSGALGLVALRNYDAAGDHCRGDLCDSEGKAGTDDARRLAGVATWVGVGGAVAAAAGAVLWITAPKRGAQRATQAQTSAAVRPTAGGVVLEGAF